MVELKRVGPMSAAKVQAILMAAVGLIEGVAFAAVGALFPATEPGIGAMGIVLFPVAFAVLGFVLGALTAWLYNVAAGWIGGVEVEFGK